MDIIIQRNIAQELDRFKLKTKLLTKGMRAGIIFLIAGIAIIFICQNDFGVTDTSLMIYLSLEVLVFMIAYVILKRVYDYKKLFIEFAKTAIKDYGDIEIYSTVTIDNEYFTYKSLRKYYKLSWSSLAMYQLYEGNLVLMMDSYTSAFVINPNELSPADFNELYSFATKNLKLRKR